MGINNKVYLYLKPPTSYDIVRKNEINNIHNFYRTLSLADSILSHIFGYYTHFKVEIKRCKKCNNLIVRRIRADRKSDLCLSCKMREIQQIKKEKLLSKITTEDMEIFSNKYLEYLLQKIGEKEEYKDLFSEYMMNIIFILKDKGLLKEIDLSGALKITRCYLSKAIKKYSNRKEKNFSELSLKNKLKLGLENDIEEY